MRKRLLAGVLSAVMMVGLIPGNITEKVGVKKDVKAAVTLQNPRIVEDSSMESGQKVTYDCVWFGSYPQTEIVDKAGTCGNNNRAWGQAADYEIDTSLYETLQKQSWNGKGEATVGENKYRRLRSEDATGTYSTDACYNWDDTPEYHYFRYDPIKWRVLESADGQLLLMADKVLDYRAFNDSGNWDSWSKSTIRSWLNGYDSFENNDGVDFSNKNFITSAFSSEDRQELISTYLDDARVSDKIWLPSSDDLTTSYGFYKYDEKSDEARRKKSTTFSKAMGAASNITTEYMGNTSWWQRTVQDMNWIRFVNPQGSASDSKDNNLGCGICPVIRVSSSSDRLKYAGIVGTDGTVNENEEEPGGDEGPDPVPAVKKSQTITASNKTIAINNKSATVGAKTNGNGKLTYTSSAKSVATVSASGIIIPKKYGTTKITIKAAETSTYKAVTKTVTVTVVPKKMTLTTAKSPAKKTLFLKWKKDKDATKYEVQLCMKKDFKEKTLSRRYGKKVVKQTIKNMRSKTWYVRIRVWKKVGGKIYYGIWSKVKKVKIK